MQLWSLKASLHCTAWFEHTAFWSAVRYAPAASQPLFDASLNSFFQFYLRLYRTTHSLWGDLFKCTFRSSSIFLCVCLIVRHEFGWSLGEGLLLAKRWLHFNVHPDLGLPNFLDVLAVPVHVWKGSSEIPSLPSWIYTMFVWKSNPEVELWTDIKSL